MCSTLVIFFVSPERDPTNVAPSFHSLAFISSKRALRASISVSCAGHEMPRPLSSSGLGILAKGISYILTRVCVGGGLLEGERRMGTVRGRMNVRYVYGPGCMVSLLWVVVLRE